MGPGAAAATGARATGSADPPTIALAVSGVDEHALRIYEAHGSGRAVQWPQWSRDA